MLAKNQLTRVETSSYVTPSGQSSIYMDAEIAALERRRDKTRAIKQGMMQQLLTGRIRLFSDREGNDRGL